MTHGRLRGMFLGTAQQFELPSKDLQVGMAPKILQGFAACMSTCNENHEQLHAHACTIAFKRDHETG